MKESTRNPESLRCGWCLQTGHHTSQCPGTKDWLIAANPLPIAEDTDALAERMHRYRTFAGQLLREMREAGLTPTPSTLALNPDPIEL